MACAPPELAASWDYVVASYDELRASRPTWAWLAPMCALVSELRDRYGATLRAGTSVTSLVLSRSRVHGLRDDQPSVTITPRETHVTIASGRERWTMRYGEAPERLWDALAELELHAID